MATRLAEVHRFTMDEYYRMAELDILPSGPMELIEGQVPRHRVVGYWLVNLTKQAVLVHPSPSPLGYRSVETRRSEDTWTSTLLPGLEVRGEDLLG